MNFVQNQSIFASKYMNRITNVFERLYIHIFREMFIYIYMYVYISGKNQW